MSWTAIARQRFGWPGLREARDLTDAEWALIEPFMPPHCLELGPGPCCCG